jgi:hypothetical protein
MFSSMNLKVPKYSSFDVHHNNAPHEQFIQTFQNACNYFYWNTQPRIRYA